MSVPADIPTEIALLKRGHDELKDAVISIKESNREISQSLNRLVLLEERHVETRDSLKRAFNSLETHSQRLNELESNQKPLLEMRQWVLGCIGLIISAVIVALIALVVK